MTVEITTMAKKATVTFTTQAKKDAAEAILTGEWDGWKSRVMKKNTNGTFSVKINIDRGKSYQFGYSIDGIWTPDTDLALVVSPFGTSNSILDLTKETGTNKTAPKVKQAASGTKKSAPKVKQAAAVTNKNTPKVKPAVKRKTGKKAAK